MKNLILARHAESDANKDGIVCADPKTITRLTSDGRHQAKVLRDQLAEVEIGLCITTQLSRSIATADIALEERPVPRLLIADFNDPCVGDFEGKPVHEFNEWLLQEGPGARPAGGESQHDAMRRYVEGYETILGRPEETILAVIHRLPILWLFWAMEGTASVPHIDYATTLRLDESSLSQALAVLRHHPIQPIPY